MSSSYAQTLYTKKRNVFFVLAAKCNQKAVSKLQHIQDRKKNKYIYLIRMNDTFILINYIKEKHTN